MEGIEILVMELMEMGIDIEFGIDHHQHGVSSTAQLIDMQTDTVIGFCRRDTMEEALFHLVAKCVDDVRRVKVDYNHADFFNKSDLEEI